MRFRFWTIGAALAGTLFAAAFAAGYANPVAPAGGAFDDANRGRALAPLAGATVRALFGAAGRMARRPEGRDGAPARRRVRVRQHARLCGRAPGGRRPHACRRVLDRPDRRDDRAVRRVRAGDRLRDRGRAAGRGGRVPCADARRDEHARSCLVVVGEGRVVASPARAGQRHRRAGNLPVTLVTQRDALAYARWLGRDLPTEAEWEYAGRPAATTQRSTRRRAMRRASRPRTTGRACSRCSTRPRTAMRLAPVGCYAANGFRIYDMIGNAWEWTKDTYTARTSRIRTATRRPSRRRRAGTTRRWSSRAARSCARATTACAIARRRANSRKPISARRISGFARF